MFGIKNKHLGVAGRFPPKSLPSHPPHFRYRKRCPLSPIEKPHLKIDYTIKMAGMGDRETWSTGWRGPPDGDHSPKKPSIGR